MKPHKVIPELTYNEIDAVTQHLGKSNKYLENDIKELKRIQLALNQTINYLS